MRLVAKARLAFQEGKSDKVYEVDLVELASRKDERYLVNFRYGRRGSKLREGTKTKDPVDLAKAEKVYNSVVVAKTNSGYFDTEAPKQNVQDTTTTASASTETNLPASPLTTSLLVHLEQEKDSKKRARLIWRLGELGEASCAPHIVKYIHRGHWLEDYSIAWALGRLDAKPHLNDLEALLNTKYEQVNSIAFEAKLFLSAPDDRKNMLSDALQNFPQEIRAAIEEGDVQHIELTLKEALRSTHHDSNRHESNQLLKALYQYTLVSAPLHQALLTYLTEIPLAPGFFKGFRAMLKAAEMRLDTEFLGRLACIVETKKHFFRADWGYVYLPEEGYRSIEVAKEMRKPNSRLAYSEKTRTYLRRRSWRVLRKLGTAGQDSYVNLAYHTLLAIRDEDGLGERHTQCYQYQRQGNRWENVLVRSNNYDSFASFIALNHILYENSQVYIPNHAGTAWEKKEGDESQQRTEAFPELWDKQPDLGLKLLLNSRCAPVHSFARKVIENNTGFLQTINTDDIVGLLASAYESTSTFGLGLAQERIENDNIDFALIHGLLTSPLEEARKLGLASLSKLALSLTNDLDQITALLLIHYPEVQQHITALYQAAHQTIPLEITTQDQLLQKIASGLFNIHHGDYAITFAHAQNLCQFINEHLQDASKHFPLTLIDRLLFAETIDKQYLGAQLLLLNDISFKDIPERLLQRINSFNNEQLKAVASALIGKQSNEALAEQLPFLIGLYKQGEEKERRALLALLARLCDNENWAKQVMQSLIDITFQAEAESSQREELQNFFTEKLSSYIADLDKDLVWRMVSAKSKLSQALGATLLQARNAHDFSVKQWAILGKNPQLSIREYAYEAYTKNIERIQAYKTDALIILDTDWNGSREFGFNYFREHFNESHWDVDTIIYLCDSVRDDIQAFGREILQSYFKEDLGGIYLAKLSQHPSHNVQLFTSSLLEEYAGDNEEKILSLEHYFTTVFSQVYRGRVCKDRVSKFLLAEAKKSQRVAHMCVELFERICLTIVHKDKSTLIQAMLQLKHMYPDLALPIAVQEPPIRAHKSTETSRTGA